MATLAEQIRGQDAGDSDSGTRVAAAAADDDGNARARDLVALLRDQAAELRDRELAARHAAEGGGGLAEAQLAAAADRAHAARDREIAARDREIAVRDRLAAERIRDALLQELAVAKTDQLTGTRTRAAGLMDIDHEISRARRTQGLLVVAFVDVVGLKAANDTRGHAAGDALLQRMTRGIRAQLRPYDVIVRLGGDEFLCAMPGATIQDARQRFAAIQVALAADGDPCQIRFGFAELGQGDSTAGLIQRSDAELLASHPGPSAGHRS